MDPSTARNSTPCAQVCFSARDRKTRPASLFGFGFYFLTRVRASQSFCRTAFNIDFVKAAKMFDAADVNKDGKISKAEFLKAMHDPAMAALK